MVIVFDEFLCGTSSCCSSIVSSYFMVLLNLDDLLEVFCVLSIATVSNNFFSGCKELDLNWDCLDTSSSDMSTAATFYAGA